MTTLELAQSIWDDECGAAEVPDGLLDSAARQLDNLNLDKSLASESVEGYSYSRDNSQAGVIGSIRAQFRAICGSQFLAPADCGCGR